MTKSLWLAVQFSHLAVHKTYKLPWLIRIYVLRKWDKSFDCPERKDGNYYGNFKDVQGFCP